jgi:hypothetical protein
MTTKTLLKSEVRGSVSRACGRLSQVNADACPDIVNAQSLDLEALTADLNTQFITENSFLVTPRDRWLPPDLAELRELTRQIGVLLDAPEAGLFSWWDSLRQRLERIRKI